MACGRVGFDHTATGQDAAADGPTAVDGAIVLDGSNAVDGANALDGAVSVGAPLFYIDASDANGAPGSAGCPGMAPSEWLDIQTGTPGVMSNFATPPCGGNGWDGDGSVVNPYRLSFAEQSNPAVSFGAIAHAQRYTLEAWVRYTGLGDATGTGSGGIRLVPIVTKGTAETEDPALDVNYSFGLTETGELGFDFEDSMTSDNHPFSADMTLSTGVWHQVAATYDQVEVRLYVDGALIASQPETAPPSVATGSILGIGSMFESDGTPKSAQFDGDIAIVRIFDRALPATGILAGCMEFAARFGISCVP